MAGFWGMGDASGWYRLSLWDKRMMAGGGEGGTAYGVLCHFVGNRGYREWLAARRRLVTGRPYGTGRVGRGASGGSRFRGRVGVLRTQRESCNSDSSPEPAAACSERVGGERGGVKKGESGNWQRGKGAYGWGVSDPPCHERCNCC